jgi:hypothetical protein
MKVLHWRKWQQRLVCFSGFVLAATDDDLRVRQAAHEALASLKASSE